MAAIKVWEETCLIFLFTKFRHIVQKELKVFDTVLKSSEILLAQMTKKKVDTTCFAKVCSKI